MSLLEVSMHEMLMRVRNYATSWFLLKGLIVTVTYNFAQQVWSRGTVRYLHRVWSFVV